LFTIKIKKNSVVIKFLKFYNIYDKGNFNSLNLKRLNCLLIKNGKKRALEVVLKELFENYQYDKDYEFDEYFKYDVNFIIKLLTYYDYNIPFSKKEFKLLLIKEKEDKSNSIINFNVIDDYCNRGYKFVDATTTPLQIACFYEF